jgi:hypothetical protein
MSPGNGSLAAGGHFGQVPAKTNEHPRNPPEHPLNPDKGQDTMLDLLLMLATTAAMQDATTDSIDTTAGAVAASTKIDTGAAPMLPGVWVTTTDMTEVRSGPSMSNYPFLRVPKGTTFDVQGDAYGFAKVQATGPAFRMATGWIRIPDNAKERFTLTTNDASDQQQASSQGTFRGRAEVLAPNINSNNLSDAFRWVCVLEDGATVDVLETVPLGTGGMMWKIRMPAQAEGWVPIDALRQATDQEATSWSTHSLGELMSASPSSPLANWQAWADTRTTWTTAVAAAQAEAIEAARVAEVEALAQAEATEAARIALAAAEEKARLAAEVAARAAYANERLDALEALVTATAIRRLDVQAAQRLIEAYTQIAEEEGTEHPDLANLARFRADQIRLASALNADQNRIKGLAAQVRQSNDDLGAEARSLDTITDYVIQGRLAVSLIFDGQNKPIMYRIEDPLSGRSLAYLEPSASLDLSSLLGQRIGVVGRMAFDHEWNVTVVEPERVDLVSVSP